MDSFLSQKKGLVNILPPVDIGGVAKTSKYFQLKFYQWASILVNLGAVTNEPTITVFAAEDNTGTNEEAIPFTYRVAPTGSDVLGANQAATTSGVGLGTADDVEAVLEIGARELPAGKGWLAIKTDAAAACLIQASAVLSGARHQGATMPTSLS
jgi:hypothetical protein